MQGVRAVSTGMGGRIPDRDAAPQIAIGPGRARTVDRRHVRVDFPAMRTHPSPTRRGGRLAIAAGVGALATVVLPATAGAALTAERVSIHSGPAAVRVAVHLGGGTLTGLERRTDTPDPSPGDGRALVRINAAGIRSVAAPLARAGVDVRVVRRGAGSIIAVLDTRPGAFKFVSYDAAAGGRRLDIRLWRATTAAAATIRDDGCLRLVAARGGDRPAVQGLELKPVFEHNVAVSLRVAGAGGRALTVKPFTTRGFRFRPDFSGYLRPGRFAGPVPFTVTARRTVMLDAWVTSAKDGSLECLVQTPVVLSP